MRGDVSDFGFTVTTIPSLRRYADERMLAMIEKDHNDMNLHDILNDGLGKYYFKLFSREHFQEENLLFWCEVESFKGREFYHADQFATLATNVYDKYISPTATMPVFISTISYLPRDVLISLVHVVISFFLQINIQNRLQDKVSKAIEEHCSGAKHHSKGRSSPDAPHFCGFPLALDFV